MLRDIPLFKVFMAPDVGDPVTDTLLSGYVGQGPKVEAFEQLLATYLANPHVVAVNSGTSGLHLALHQLKLRDPNRDEVLTVPLTCTATNFAIVANGLKIKWVDIDPKTCNVDLADLRRKMSDRTLAIMVVHWGGYPVDLDELFQIRWTAFSTAGLKPPPVIEDCAHAFGAEYKGERVGCCSDNICVFSFQAIKHLTTGDGGAITYPCSGLHTQGKLLRWYGLDRTSSAGFRCEQNVKEWGFKFHMNDIAATIGIQNFAHVPKIVAAHKANARQILAGIASVKGITLLENKPDRESSYWVLTVRAERRDEFAAAMKSRGVHVGRVHDRNDKHDCLREFRSLLPGTDEVCADMICLPCGWWLTDDDVLRVVDAVKAGW